jgi:protein-disulfide isomerase
MLSVHARTAALFVLLTGFVAAPAAATTRSVAAVERPELGAAEAPVVIVVFSDYQCTFCKAFFTERLPEIRREFIDTGRARLVSRDFPLPRHPRALPAAKAAACADRQDRYWDMHEILFSHQDRFSDQQLAGYASELGLDSEKFEQCLADPVIEAQIQEDLAEVRRARISGTPTFLIGVERDGIISGTLIKGFQPVSVFAAEIREYLEQTAQQPGAD